MSKTTYGWKVPTYDLNPLWTRNEAAIAQDYLL